MLERARRRRDKLVTPKIIDHRKIAVAATPPLPSRQPRKTKPEIAIIDDPNDYIIADELVRGDGQGDVLFEESEFYGEYNFRDSILDQLDRYWFYISRMRRHSRNSYEFYRQLGAVLIPPSASGSNWKEFSKDKLTAEEIAKMRSSALSPWFRKTRPTWGCIAYGVDPLTEAQEIKHDVLSPKFLYFCKYDQAPPETQAIAAMGHGDIYKLTVWWDTPTSRKGRRPRKWGVPNDIPVFVGVDGAVVPLKSIETRMVKIGRCGNNFDYARIPQRAWRFPEHYESWAAQYGIEVELQLRSVFVNAMRDFEESQYAMARVSISKGDLTAVFGINPRRLAYFFKDRDIVIEADGKRKKIIHYVAPYIRDDGAPVKAHFRGVREFTWAGYKVFVTIPGRDHINLPELTFPVSDEFWKRRGEQYMYEPEMARRINDIVHGAPLSRLAEGEFDGQDQAAG
jgi:hypothetical protein